MSVRYARLSAWSSAEVAPIALGRNSTANGGWEWFLVIGGQPTFGPGHTCGHFTDPDAREEDVLVVLLRRVAAA